MSKSIRARGTGPERGQSNPRRQLGRSLLASNEKRSHADIRKRIRKSEHDWRARCRRVYRERERMNKLSRAEQLKHIAYLWKSERQNLELLSDRFVSAKSSLAVVLSDDTVVGPPAGSSLRAYWGRFQVVVRRRLGWIMSLCDMVGRLKHLRCPFCGNHSAFRFCWTQNLRSYLLTLESSLDSLGGCNPEDKLDKMMVLAGLYGWKNMGVRNAVTLIGDLRALALLLGVSPLGILFPGFLRRLGTLVSDFSFIAFGTPLVDVRRFTDAIIVAQSRRTGSLDPAAVVWGLWYFVRDFLFSYRGTPLRLLNQELVCKVVQLTAKLQRSWFSGSSGDSWMITYVDEAESVFLKEAGAITGSVLLAGWLEEVPSKKPVPPPAAPVLPSWFKAKGPKAVYRDAVVKPRFRPLESTLTPSRSRDWDAVDTGLVIGQTARNPGFLLQSILPVGPLVDPGGADVGKAYDANTDSVMEAAFDGLDVDSGYPRSMVNPSSDAFVPYDEVIAEQRATIHPEGGTIVAKLSDEQETLLSKAAEENPECTQQ